MNNNLDISSEYEIYCFDIFDTIISRSIHPEFIKKLWSKEIAELYSIPMKVYEIYELRNQIETELCNANLEAGNSQEFQYEKLIECLYNKILRESSITFEEFLDNALDLEFEIEIRNQKLCNDVMDIIKKLKEKKKIIYCVSDFYMNKEFIKKMLEYHNVLQYINEIFVSSDYLATKRDGRLFEIVKKRNLNSETNICMIGDNIYSDYESAKTHGLNAYLINREEQYQYYEDSNVKKSKYNVEIELKDIYKKCKRDSYEDITFALYDFVERVYFELKKRKIKNVFFLSREGEFLKKLFDYYQTKRNVCSRITSHYLIVSRKSTFLPSLKELKYEKFNNIFRQYINISLYDFLSNLGFEEKEQIKICNILGADLYKKEGDFPNSHTYKTLLTCETFINLYESRRVEQRDNFNLYLNSFGVDFSKETFCMVDVGWKGTIQDNIFEFYNKEKNILGLYLGLVAPGSLSEKNEKKGLLFDSVNGEVSQYFKIYDENKSIFEVLLGASHGSADSYVKGHNGIKVETAQQDEEKKLYESLIKPIQNGLFECFKVIDDAMIDELYEIDDMKKIFADIQARFVFMPTKKQLDIFYKIYHFENFGVFEFTKFKKEEKKSLNERIKKCCLFIKNREELFKNSFWKAITLKDSGLAMIIKPYGYYRYKKIFKGEYK